MLCCVLWSMLRCIAMLHGELNDVLHAVLHSVACAVLYVVPYPVLHVVLEDELYRHENGVRYDVGRVFFRSD